MELRDTVGGVSRWSLGVELVGVALWVEIVGGVSRCSLGVELVGGA